MPSRRSLADRSRRTDVGRRLGQQLVGELDDRRGHPIAEVELGEVEDVILGCAAPEGATGSNVARVSAMRAGAPVSVSGVTVSRATLHNQDELDRKDVRIGDTVRVRRAGDVIPEVVEVLKDKRPPNTKRFELPSKCPVSGSEIVGEQKAGALGGGPAGGHNGGNWGQRWNGAWNGDPATMERNYRESLRDLFLFDRR